MKKFKSWIRKGSVKRIICALSVCMILVSLLAFSCSAAEGDSQVDQFVDGAKSMGDAFYGSGGIWTSVINFITANPICLIGLFSFILVLGVSMVRRLFTA